MTIRISGRAFEEETGVDRRIVSAVRAGRTITDGQLSELEEGLTKLKDEFIRSASDGVGEGAGEAAADTGSGSESESGAGSQTGSEAESGVGPEVQPNGGANGGERDFSRLGRLIADGQNPHVQVRVEGPLTTTTTTRPWIAEAAVPVLEPRDMQAVLIAEQAAVRLLNEALEVRSRHEGWG